MDLMKLYEGYVRNYHRFQLTFTHGRSSATISEIEYFSRLGSMLGYWTFTEDTLEGTYRPMDLTWWDKYDPATGEWNDFVLHLEKENSPRKSDVTLEKLYSETRNVQPQNSIGIITVRKEERIKELLEKALGMCKIPNALLIFRLKNVRAEAYILEEGKVIHTKKANIADIAGNLYMYFPEEHRQGVKP